MNIYCVLVSCVLATAGPLGLALLAVPVLVHLPLDTAACTGPDVFGDDRRSEVLLPRGGAATPRLGDWIRAPGRSMFGKIANLTVYGMLKR